MLLPLQPAGPSTGTSYQSNSGIFAAGTSSGLGVTAQEGTNANAISRSSSRSSKRARIDSPISPDVAAELAKPSILSRLPSELLAEVLLYSRSPKTLLNVARTNKYLCHTLLDPASSFIWRAIRAGCCVPIPNPTPNFTEPSYAAFIFDAGKCEVCHNQTRALYSSFTLRARLCGNVSACELFDSLQA